MFDLRTRFRVIWGPDYPLNRIREDEIRQLIGRQECTEKGPAVNGQDQYFL